MEYDEVVEDEGSQYVYDEPPASSWTDINPVTFLLEFLSENGWFLLFAGFVVAYCVHWVKNNTNWFKGDPDAEYKKDPDKALARMEAVQRARELQQRKLEEASRRALEQQKEREERKRAEALERLQKYGTAAGQKLGTKDDDYLPLSAGPSTSSYRPPKKSKCGGGGCGQ